MKITKYCLTVFASTAFFSCAIANKEHSTYSVYFISPDDKATIKKKALSGDAHSSRKLGEHYYYSLSNMDEAKFWLRLSSEQGSEEAIFSLVNILRKNDNNREAIRWMNTLVSSDKYQKEANTTLSLIYNELGDQYKTNYYRCMSALLGERFSAKQLSDFYFNEEGGIKSPEKAFLWSFFIVVRPMKALKHLKI